MPVARVLALLAALAALASCAQVDERVQAVPALDVERYLGTWYDVGSFPQSFQQGCFCTTAEYSKNDDGSLRVENTCRKDGVDGERDVAVGRATREDDAEPAKLRVEFFAPFKGNYWVIQLDDPPAGEDYRWAVVSEPTKQYLWILSRTPELDDGVRADIVANLQALDYDLTKLEDSKQPGCWQD